MIHISEKEPAFQDEVKNKNNDTTGVVIAKYPGEGNRGNLLDVRGHNNRIYYGTPAALWEVVRECDE